MYKIGDIVQIKESKGKIINAKIIEVLEKQNDLRIPYVVRELEKTNPFYGGYYKEYIIYEEDIKR